MSLVLEELYRPAQSPELNPICDELEWRLRGRPSLPISVADATNSLLDEGAIILAETLQNLLENDIKTY